MIRASQTVNQVVHALHFTDAGIAAKCGLRVKGAKSHHGFTAKVATVTCTECRRRLVEVQAAQ